MFILRRSILGVPGFLVNINAILEHWIEYLIVCEMRKEQANSGRMCYFCNNKEGIDL